MMAAAHKKWSKELCTSVSRMEAAVNVIVNTHTPSAQAQRHLANTLEQLQDLRTQGKHHQNVAMYPGMQLCLAEFSNSFSTLLTALAAPLEKHGRILTSASTHCIVADKDLFWLLWKTLSYSGLAFHTVHITCKHLSNAELVSAFEPLYQVFPTLLAWLLAITRSMAWVSNSTAHGISIRQQDLIFMLGVPVHCIAILSILSLGQSTDKFRSILSDIFPLLCSILSEQYSTTFPLLPLHSSSERICATANLHRMITTKCGPSVLYTLFDKVTSALLNLAYVRIVNQAEDMSFLASPTVLSFLKDSLLFVGELRDRLPHDTHALRANAMWLCVHLHTELTQAKAAPFSPSLVQNQAASKNVEGQFADATLQRNRHGVETDLRLLDILDVEGFTSPDLASRRLLLQGRILQDWICLSMLRSVDQNTLARIASGVMRIAKQCMFYGWQQQQQQFVRDRGALDSVENSAHRQDCSNSMRHLMFLTSQFNPAGLCNILQCEIGE